MKEIVVCENIERKIYFIRKYKVLLDSDLATLYGVTTGNLNKAVKRNRGRFPDDFMFQLADKEYEALRFQVGISKRRRGGRQYLPYVFTEQGVAMLSTVLNSERAIQVNIQIMRAFVRLREILFTHKELAEKLSLLEQKVGKHDKEIRIIFQAIQELIEASKEEPPKEEPPKRQIGFHRYD